MASHVFSCLRTVSAKAVVTNASVLQRRRFSVSSKEDVGVGFPIWGVYSALALAPAIYLLFFRESDTSDDKNEETQKIRKHLSSVLERPHERSKNVKTNDEVKFPLIETLPLNTIENDTKSPQTTTKRQKYVLVGGGTASNSAVSGIRDVDPDADILIISADEYPPYRRTKLNKPGFSNLHNLSSSSNGSEEQNNGLFYHKLSEYEIIDKLNPTQSICKGISKILLNTKVVALNIKEKNLTLNTGEKLEYDKILLATGPKTDLLPPKAQCEYEKLPESIRERVIFYRSLRDNERLVAALNQAKNLTSLNKPLRIAVVGGGLTSSELASSLASENGHHVKVTQIVQDSQHMARLIPPQISDWVAQRIFESGVNVIKNVSIKEVSAEYNNDGEAVGINLSLLQQDLNTKINESTHNTPPLLVECFDHVLVAGASSSDDRLAQKAGLEIDPYNGGIVVSHELMASTDVYAAGDSASYYDRENQIRRRAAFYQAAETQGYVAGRNMAGDRKFYSYEPAFTALVAGKKIEGVGLVSTVSPNSTATICSDHDGALKRCIVFYMNRIINKEDDNNSADAVNENKLKDNQKLEDRIIGVLTVNLPENDSGPGHIALAKRIVRAKLPKEDAIDLAKMFPLYDSE